MPDAWLTFSLDPEADPVHARPADAPPLDYGGYLGLDALLNAGAPQTSSPKVGAPTPRQTRRRCLLAARAPA